MDCRFWIGITYIVVGLVFAFHWFEEDYGEDYKEACKKGEEEKGMTSMLLLILAIFWPFIFVYKLIKAL